MLTPQTEEKALAQALGIESVFLKREDFHPYGSHKGRSIPVMIDRKASKGAKGFAISSSGNAALAAIRHVKARNAAGAGLSLSVLVGRHIHPEKKLLLELEARGDDRVEISAVERPLQMLLELVRGHRKESLSQSNDDEALLGYKALADELALIPSLSAVFIGSSSGTCAQALASHFSEAKLPIEVHIVQTTACHPLAKAAGAEISEAPEKESLADAIVDKVAYRREALSKAIAATDGTGWIADNAGILEAQRLLAGSGVTATGNGALALAGLAKAVKQGRTFAGAVACIVTGK